MLHGEDAFQFAISFIEPAILFETFEEGLPHFQIFGIAGRLVQIIGRFHNLGIQKIPRAGSFHFHVIEIFRLNAMPVPHLQARFLQPRCHFNIPRKNEAPREEGVKCPEPGFGPLAGYHVCMPEP